MSSALNMATSPPPNLQTALAPYYSQVTAEIQTQPGTIAAAPPNHTGLVNLPQCFWLTGQSVPDQKSVSVSLQGAPNAAGKQITYHITLTVKFDHTDWNFGDGSSATTQPPIDCVGISGDPASLVAHTYVNYSQGSPNDSFLVTASETYRATAVMTWTDDNGPQQEDVPLSPATETVTTAPYAVQIDQEEAVGTAP